MGIAVRPIAFCLGRRILSLSLGSFQGPDDWKIITLSPQYRRSRDV